MCFFYVNFHLPNNKRQNIRLGSDVHAEVFRVMGSDDCIQKITWIDGWLCGGRERRRDRYVRKHV